MRPLHSKNAIAAIRVSTTKQGTDSDSPDAQKEQIERYAENHGITIKKFFLFLESASKEQQPMQEAVDYCKDPKNEVDLFIIKSIDRFTRGGSLSYDLLKTQLDKCSVTLVDTYGVISHEQINTLAHLGQEYKWSTYSPSRKSEMLEAERSKDEVRDILSRVIGAEIRYTQMGYWMRQTLYGFRSEKVETQHGKRMILKPHPDEAKYMVKLFELRASGQFSDREIAKKLNDMGYRGRSKMKRAKGDKMRIIGQTKPALLDEKKLWKMVRNPIYAGVNMEKWTHGQPVKCMFDGLVSIDLFNRANKGKRTIIEMPNGKIAVTDNVAPEHATPKGARHPDFAFKKFVMCPQCNKPLLGSSSRGKTGQYYSYYHCDKRGHKFRVKKEDLEQRVLEFVGSLEFSSHDLDTLFDAVKAAYEKRVGHYQAQINMIDGKITDLTQQAREMAKNFATIVPSAQQYLNEELGDIDKQIKQLSLERMQMEAKKPMNIDHIIARVRYFVENLDELVVKQIDPVKKAQFFGLIFRTLPTYDDLGGRNQKTPLFTGVNPLFQAIAGDNFPMVTPAGFEPAIFWMRTRCPRPLDEGAVSRLLAIVHQPYATGFGNPMQPFVCKH
jgi:site-specific DNA recombinase